MKLSQSQKQSLILTTSLKQSLSVLQMSIPELQSYINDIIVENPLVDLDHAPSVQPTGSTSDRFYSKPAFDPDSDMDRISNLPDQAQQETFTSHLMKQLPQIAQYLPERFIPICSFIIESLDRRGYLDEPVTLLAASMGASVEDVTQGLYAVQSLTPTGVGARTLEECLILQLVESPFFNEYTLAIIQHHLETLAKRDFTQIARVLGISVPQVKQYFEFIRSLNPIPSNGFLSVQDDNHYIVPEAYVEIQGDQLQITENRDSFSLPVVNEDYLSIIESSSDPQVQTYIIDKVRQLKQLQTDVQKRCSTLSRVIELMVLLQRKYLLNLSPAPSPLSVQQLADALKLHPSTISRAIQDKYISVSGHIIPLKSLLCAQIGNGIPVSRAMLKLYMDKLIAGEDPLRPLSDEGLSAALFGMGICISRRTVAEYRTEFGIPTASKRKKSHS